MQTAVLFNGFAAYLCFIAYAYAHAHTEDLVSARSRPLLLSQSAHPKLHNAQP